MAFIATLTEIDPRKSGTLLHIGNNQLNWKTVVLARRDLIGDLQVGAMYEFKVTYNRSVNKITYRLIEKPKEVYGPPSPSNLSRAP